MNLLESYIRSFILKESINMEDSKKIQSAIKKLDEELNSNNLNLSSLNFDPLLIQELRDLNQVIRVKEEDRQISQNKTEINYDTDAKVRQLGLGFNVISCLKEDSWNSNDGGIHKKKIIKLINSLEKVNKNKYRKKIKLLKDTLHLKQALDEAGLKMLGAGLYRAAISIPGMKSAVLKIALSEKGREVSEKEIEFSKGVGASRLDHVKNFPTIYDHNEDGSWYAIEKVMMIDKKIFTNISKSSNPKLTKEIISDVKYQFPETFKFLSNISVSLKKASKDLLINIKNLDTSNDDILKLFIRYLRILFSKRESYSTAHDEAFKATRDAIKISSKAKRKTTKGQSGNFSVNLPDTALYGDSTPYHSLNNDVTPLHSIANEVYSRVLKESKAAETNISFNIMSEKIDKFLTLLIQLYLKEKNIEILKATEVKDDIGLDATVDIDNDITPIHNKTTNNKNVSDIDNLKLFVIKDILSTSSINKMIDEIGSMFDQAVVTDIIDLHLGNMGFKKNDSNRWQLIFTDIDTDSSY